MNIWLTSGKKGKDLPSLNLASLGDVSDDQVIQLVNHCPDLFSLIVSSDQITHRTCQALCLSNPRLIQLDLAGSASLTDEALESIKAFKNLIFLSLYACDKLTDSGFYHLRELKNLKYLNLYSCKNLTDEGLSFVKTLQKLLTLDLSNCKRLSDKG